jgi:hypothetical protein
MIEAAYGEPGGQPTHDFNPNGPNAEDRIPKNAKWKDASNWNSNTMHISLYDYYNRLMIVDYGYQDCVKIDGEFLMDVRGQSQLADYVLEVPKKLKRRAQYMLDEKLHGDQKWEFSDCNSKLITADLLSTNVRLSLQRFTVFWEANCTIGPMEANVEMSNCDDKCGSRAQYRCDIKWTVYDLYDFRWWEPYSWLGHSYPIFGSWSDSARGTVESCKNE